jgi:hypothetical protein
MPYRRLPTTDKARIRAIGYALKAAAEKEDGKLAFSKNSLYELTIIKNNFESCLKQYEFDFNIESEKNVFYKASFNKARLYVSHFIQTLYMCIEREEIKEEILSHYGLEDLEFRLPAMNSEEELLSWGWKIIQGEKKRLQNGGSAIYNPSIALVKAKVESFQEVAIFQQNLKKNTVRSYGKLKETRKTTNEFIGRLWTEIENNLGNVTPQQKRQRAQEYGIVYIYRRKEKKKLRVEGVQVDLLFDFN